MNQLRELDQKVRSLLEKDLQSQLKKFGIDLGFSAASNELYVPVQMFLNPNLDSFPFGMGGPNYMSFSGVPVSAPSLRSTIDPEFYNKAKSIEDNLSWLRAEMMVREKSFNEIIQVVEKKDKLITMVPMRWPTWGRVSSSYGWRKDPFTGRKAWHTGVDIAAPAGRNIVATAAGKVIFAGWNGNYGRCVIIRHQFGYETVYGHLSKIQVENGEEVKKETIIGKVGSSGRSTGPHLHYEVRKYGNVINPWPYLP
jgi:murein DD-endopeptidase MepM/ murein hydrolase activator NlpD